MNEYSTSIDLNKKRFKRLTFFFWSSMISLLAIFLFPIDTSFEKPQTLRVIFFLTFIVSHFLFLVYINRLAHSSGRSSILWWFGSGMLPPFSSFIGYYRMQVIALKNGWTD
jgi:hypothetical protein